MTLDFSKQVVKIAFVGRLLPEEQKARSRKVSGLFHLHVAYVYRLPRGRTANA